MKKAPPHALVSKVSSFMAKHRLLNGVRRLGVAVSGGADSTALLHVLHALHLSEGIELHVLHVNHGLRGAASDADESFVRDMAAELGLHLQVLRIPAGSSPASGLELWARQKRLEFFIGQMAELSLDRIATGHTERDQAETVLFRLLRGTGPDGLRGILPCSAQGFIRPLLGISRLEVRDFLIESEISWREDVSNSDLTFARNRLRKKWIPELRNAWNPNLEHALAQAAGIAACESAYLDEIAEQESIRVFSHTPYGWEAPVESLRTLHIALLRRVLRLLAWREARATPEFQHLEQIVTLATRPKNTGRFTFRRLLAERSGAAFRIAHAGSIPVASSLRASVGITGPGRYCLPAVPGVFEVAEVTDEARRMNKFNELNSGYTEGWSLIGPLDPGSSMLLRCWRPGDTFIERHSGSRRKLKELFQRFSVPRWRRTAAAVLEIDGEIVWCSAFGASAGHAVPGLDAAGDAPLPASSPECWCMAIRYEEPAAHREAGKRDRWNPL
ncbi:MAG: tRNA lysidine(34) synthetase TilS [Bryobacterales bacterium]|nr:tRNA lysidine(34) synthetase TilS [Bryobacterales bacterium]